jgi:hypothetical protein
MDMANPRDAKGGELKPQEQRMIDDMEKMVTGYVRIKESYRKQLEGKRKPVLAKINQALKSPNAAVREAATRYHGILVRDE